MSKKSKNNSGMTLIESLIAMTILLVGLLSMAQVLAVSVIASKTHGRDAGKTTAAAREKMEELNSLDFSDTSANVTQNAPFPSDGVGLTAGGSIHPADPVQGYCDYLNETGGRMTSGSPSYTRQWQIIDDAANPNVKTIAVSVTSNRSFEYGAAPSTTIVTQKTP